MTEAYPPNEQAPDTPVLTWVHMRRGQLKEEGAEHSQASDQARLSGDAIGAKLLAVEAAKADAARAKLADAQEAIAAAEHSNTLYDYLGEVTGELETLEARLVTTHLAVEILGERVPRATRYENNLANTRMRAERNILYELQQVVTNTLQVQSFDNSY